MGDVVEQRPDGQQEQHGYEPHGDQASPGSAIEPARSQQPAPQEPASPPALDPEQARQFEQFRQFQQFQEFQRFQEAQQQAGTDVAAVPGQQLVPPPPKQRPKVPGWLQWLGKKLIGWLIFFILLAIALTWAYNYFFGGGGDPEDNAAKIGGGGIEKNVLMPTDPYAAVRAVYDNIAQNDDQACLLFDAPNGISEQFAADVGASDCASAVTALNQQVTNANDYAESIPSSVPTEEYEKVADLQPGDTLTIDSCVAAAYTGGVKGGPALGTFTLTKQNNEGQWLITGHERGPETCR